MPVLHFLNVRNGDCSIIEHGSGRATMVDVNNARLLSIADAAMQKLAAAAGNFNQKNYPVNPIEYMRDRKIDSIFRFIVTHPDMDHMDGIVDLFQEFSPPNFWDTENTCDKASDDWESCPYRREDWNFYCRLRSSTSDPKRLVYYSSEPPCDFWREDGLKILAPTTELVTAANACEEWNDASYVLRYSVEHSGGGPSWKVILAGDSHDGTWNHILETHEDAVADVDLLLAPHHGRDSDRDYSFLDVLKPKLTLFGNASSKHLGYPAWNRRNLPIITNNQAGSVIIDFASERGSVYATNQTFAEARLGEHADYKHKHKAWLSGFVR